MSKIFQAETALLSKRGYKMVTYYKMLEHKKGLHRCKPCSIWWVVRDLNPGPKDYESSALTN
ncbi:hypothetical protein NTG1052_980006 [Candidatus Nitrotoga sp. 1052]|nr:hypothetical protein NTG1052_980006 [Candidatus Nitrotoga sp. 1052]